MKILLAERFTEDVDMKVVKKAVLDLFGDYNRKKIIANQYIRARKLEKKEEQLVLRKMDPTFDVTVKREEVIKYVKDFEKHLKEMMTEQELMVLNLSIQKRKIDAEVMKKMDRSLNTYRKIKKSCYVKIAISFGLMTSM